MNSTKNVLSRLKMTGDPNVDFIKQLQSDLKKLGNGKFEAKVVFSDPNQFTEGLKQIKETKVTYTVKKEQSPPKKPLPVAQSPDDIDESIQDEYSFGSEPVSDLGSSQKKQQRSRNQSRSSLKKSQLSNSGNQFEEEDIVEQDEMVINHQQLSFHAPHEIKPERVLSMMTGADKIVETKFQFNSDTFKQKKKVREAGYEFTKDDFKAF